MLISWRVIRPFIRPAAFFWQKLGVAEDTLEISMKCFQPGDSVRG